MKEKQQDRNDFLALCSYIQKEILMYGNDKAFPKMMALRLKGIAYGKYVLRGKTEQEVQIYPYKTILATVILNKGKILQGLSVNEFKDEQHKVNYIAKIIEIHINDTVDMMNRKKKSKEKGTEIKKELKEERFEYSYVPKTEEKKESIEENDGEYSISKILSDLW